MFDDWCMPDYLCVVRVVHAPCSMLHAPGGALRLSLKRMETMVRSVLLYNPLKIVLIIITSTSRGVNMETFTINRSYISMLFN